MLTYLHGRPPMPHLFPLNLFFYQMDMSDPYTFLAIKRGILRMFTLELTNFRVCAHSTDPGHSHSFSQNLWQI